MVLCTHHTSSWKAKSGEWPCLRPAWDSNCLAKLGTVAYNVTPALEVNPRELRFEVKPGLQRKSLLQKEERKAEGRKGAGHKYSMF